MPERAAAAGQVVPGTALRTLFAMLRPNDLVYNYLVSRQYRPLDPAPGTYVDEQRLCRDGPI